jgi:hypothetical protein
MTATSHEDSALLFESGRIRGRPGRYLQVTLKQVDPARLHGLPDRSWLMQRVSRELQVLLPDAGFEQQLVIEIDGRRLTASAEVVARMGLVEDALNHRERARLREVTDAGYVAPEELAFDAVFARWYDAAGQLTTRSAGM